MADFIKRFFLQGFILVGLLSAYFIFTMAHRLDQDSLDDFHADNLITIKAVKNVDEFILQRVSNGTSEKLLFIKETKEVLTSGLQPFKEQQVWHLDDEELLLNTSLLNRIEAQLKQFKVQPALRTDDDDLAVYGLIEPQATISVNPHGDFSEAYQIKIGNATPTAQNYYVMLGGGREVYLLDAYTVRPFLEARTNFLNWQTTIVNWQNLKNIEVINANGHLIIEKTSEVINSGALWQMNAPYDNIIIDSYNLEQGLMRLWQERFTFVRQNMIAHPQGLINYGLNAPQAQIEFQDEHNNKLQLLIGAVADDNVAYYVKEVGQEPIFTIDSELAEQTIEVKAFDIAQKFVGLYFIDNIDTLVIETFGKPLYNVTISQQSGQKLAQKTFKINNKVWEEADFKNFFLKILTIFYEGEKDPPIFDDKQIEFSLAYQFLDQSARLIEFAPIAKSNFYAVRYDREHVMPFVVGKYQIDQFLANAASLNSRYNGGDNE